MRAQRFFFLMALVGAGCALSSCTSNQDVWENTKSAGRHMQRGIRALGGEQGDSRQIRSRSDFECIEDDACYSQDNLQEYDYQNQYDDGMSSSQADSFIPLNDPNHELNGADMVAPPPREAPGEPGSSIPGIQAFRDPSTIPQLANTFRPIYFAYDSSLIKGADNLETLHAMADFLRCHPNIYVFIEGHTDERGPQAYNLALGSRRSNTVRNAFISEGVDSDRLFTVSYGKERPVVLERHEEGWAKNRRAEFKIYER